ncbi:ABC transporter ATP-binding protein [Lactonifactor longoviformis]|uniref:ATP-binding cassette, subfamily B n=1 Tax=Lactonifactor longoviformis DSM 17459 TaxID=1122155 RepID=A0A1M4U4Y8_9CLOT|nr:ABC transporter ATP-binding protein [Lactonifactor longoviformis]SHE51696.1 ATP-binding cassette, subfamily B [Lactonifactor longoviformis DSM 17459]
MRELIRYLKDYKKESIMGPLFKMLEACFELIVPLVMAAIIDTGIRNHDRPYIWRMGLLLVSFGVLGLICSLTAQYFAAKAAMGFGTALRRDLFAHINNMSYTELDILGTPTLVTRMTSDINQAQAGVNLVLRLFLRSPFIVVGAVLMAFTISVKMTVIFLIAVPVISLIIYFIVKSTIPIYKSAQAALDRVSLLTRENHIGARVVRAFSKQQEEISRFEETTGALTRIQLHAGRISALLNPATYVVVNLAIMAILWSGGYVVDSGEITQGELIALINYMSQILLALIALANLIITFTKATASAIRINEVFHTQPSMCGGEKTGSEGDGEVPAVEFRGVSFSYANAKENALEEISFSAAQGETIGIIGGTGSGKSTLVHLIPRLYDTSEGEVLFRGRSIQEYQLEYIRSRIGLVPQKAVLFQGTLRDNMKWGKEDASDSEIREALDIAQARDFVEAKEEGLDLKIQQGGSNLSGGQRQRLTIARALVGKPDILILDDSASALDFATDAALRKAIKEKTRGMTVFIVSQRASSIKYADKILVLDDGRMAGMGTHRELMENCRVYEEICTSQLSGEEVQRG